MQPTRGHCRRLHPGIGHLWLKGMVWMLKPVQLGPMIVMVWRYWMESHLWRMMSILHLSATSLAKEKESQIVRLVVNVSPMLWVCSTWSHLGRVMPLLQAGRGLHPTCYVSCWKARLGHISHYLTSSHRFQQPMFQ